MSQTAPAKAPRSVDTQVYDLASKIVEFATPLLAEARHGSADLLTGLALAGALNSWAPDIAIAAHRHLSQEAVAQLGQIGCIDTQVTDLIDLLHEFLQLSGYEFDREWRQRAPAEVAHAS